MGRGQVLAPRGPAGLCSPRGENASVFLEPSTARSKKRKYQETNLSLFLCFSFYFLTEQQQQQKNCSFRQAVWFSCTRTTLEITCNINVLLFNLGKKGGEGG